MSDSAKELAKRLFFEQGELDVELDQAIMIITAHDAQIIAEAKGEMRDASIAWIEKHFSIAWANVYRRALPLDMEEPKEITYLTIGGHSVPADLAVCPVCNILDLNMGVDTTDTPWLAQCTKGHEWNIRITQH